MPQRGQSPAAWEAGLFLESILLAAQSHIHPFLVPQTVSSTTLCPNMLAGPGDPGHTMLHYSPRNL